MRKSTYRLPCSAEAFCLYKCCVNAKELECVFESARNFPASFFKARFSPLWNGWSRERCFWWPSPRGVKKTIKASRMVNYSHDLWVWETKWHNQMQMRCCNGNWPRKSAIWSRIHLLWDPKSNYQPIFLRKTQKKGNLAHVVERGNSSLD